MYCKKQKRRRRAVEVNSQFLEKINQILVMSSVFYRTHTF